ncbi:hypothetical protein GPY51_09210 [Photorhabdus laumondii subsp. laumondii]|uniref:Uncharacterized protein n=1 Tax=Photorhabdus laumondii subsp. laumondii TaxID=141679 RepID=A0A6L9JQU2_PHOLM|nr:MULTISPECIES: hypothetical protein [Photorhabdus]MCC8382526.1 hypothetical protein [Photorhabdus laumondii]MCC8387821.1 hypothetical protein [Photorhabdus laumondii]MCC8411440.1 hypothetical protein [Photorhabdus laumondii]MCZ1251131.1 hypothetical protein [Photorhabdus laumondii subsp. laumondii]NDK94537.1 hypothetical protein [Photorhabdus laumondii subsp. laumondii]
MLKATGRLPDGLSYVSVIYFRNARISSKSAINSLRTMIAVSINAFTRLLQLGARLNQPLPLRCLSS